MPTTLQVTNTAQQSGVVNTSLDLARRAAALLSSPNANCMKTNICSPNVHTLAKYVTFRANTSENINERASEPCKYLQYAAVHDTSSNASTTWYSKAVAAHTNGLTVVGRAGDVFWAITIAATTIQALNWF